MKILEVVLVRMWIRTLAESALSKCFVLSQVLFVSSHHARITASVLYHVIILMTAK